VEKRRLLIASVILLAAVVAVVNAAAFVYRWMEATVYVAPATRAVGAGCVGFYSSLVQQGIPLPDAGTNYGAITYGTDINTIIVIPGNVVCQWTYRNNTYYLYESIFVELPVTVGSWYVRDFYGFGYYPQMEEAPEVYVWIKVEEPVSGVQAAKLILYKAGVKVAEVDLTTTGTYGPYTLYAGEAFQLDLLFDTDTPGTYSFKVGFYASQLSEQPR